jgi:sRNA-binding carbon storage regulator CsrA
MKNNLNPKTNPITTILGAVLLTIGLGSFVMPMFLELREDLNIYLKAAFTLSGFLCLLAPDALVGIVTDALKKFLSNKNNATILVVGFCIFLSACAPKPPVPSKQSSIKDSVYVKEVLRVDTVHIKGDSVKIIIQNPCENGQLSKEFKSAITKTSKSTRAKVQVKETEKGLEIKCNCEEEMQLINSKNLEIYKLHSELNSEVKQVEVYKTHWYDITARWIAGFTIALLAIVVLDKILR